MKKNITEKEFINEYGKSHYTDICNAAYKAMRNTQKFKEKKDMLSGMAFPWKVDEFITIYVEATLKWLPDGYVNFGLVKIWLSDEECSDDILDRCNELKTEYGGEFQKQEIQIFK